MRDLIARIPADDPTLAADRARLDLAREARRQQAAAYFEAKAGEWDHIRAMHAPDAQVEAAILDLVGDAPVQALLDLGAGTGRTLELLAPLAERAVGVDLSPAMLNLARARIEERGLRKCNCARATSTRRRWSAAPTTSSSSIRCCTSSTSPAARLPRPRAAAPGRAHPRRRFAAHEEEGLREHFAHRRLGFLSEEIAAWMKEAGLDLVETRRIAPNAKETGKLTVVVWLARDSRFISDDLRKAQGSSPDAASPTRLSRAGSPVSASFEFFPPKSPEMEATLWEAIARLAPLNPDFVSVTYGAGGSTRARTHATVEKIARETYLARPRI